MTLPEASSADAHGGSTSGLPENHDEAVVPSGGGAAGSGRRAGGRR
jgi:hypothetical protein